MTADSPPGTQGAARARSPVVIAIFGPTAVGKTGVAIELGRLLEERGEAAVAVNCDAIQVYRGLEIISGAADDDQRRRLEHRLLSFVPLDREFSAGTYSDLAHAEIDGLLGQGRWPILVGGTGLYLRAALAEIDFRPPVSQALRRQVEAEIAELGSAAVHAELPARHREAIHPNDRKRIARATELLRSGESPAPDHRGGGELWTARLRRPAMLAGLVDEDEALRARIAARVGEMARAGAREEAERAVATGASRTARAAIGFDQFLEGDLESAARRHRRYAKRQMTWMRKMEGVSVFPRLERSDLELAKEILGLVDLLVSRNAAAGSSG